MSSYILRIRKFLEKENLNARKFAQIIGISEASVSRILKGTDKPSLDTLVSIAIHCKLNMNWLLSGQGSMFLSPEGIEADRRIPIVSVIHAGIPCEAQDDFYGWEYVSDKHVPNNVDCAVIVEGDSMLPTLQQGDIVYVTQAADISVACNRDLVIVSDGTGSVIRRLRRHSNTILFLPDNEDYPPIVMPPIKVQLQGIVRGYRRIFSDK
jgi:SOS-response transcriptional repressor LexA